MLTFGSNTLNSSKGQSDYPSKKLYNTEEPKIETDKIDEEIFVLIFTQHNFKEPVKVDGL